MTYLIATITILILLFIVLLLVSMAQENTMEQSSAILLTIIFVVVFIGVAHQGINAFQAAYENQSNLSEIERLLNNNDMRLREANHRLQMIGDMQWDILHTLN